MISRLTFELSVKNGEEENVYSINYHRRRYGF